MQLTLDSLQTLAIKPSTGREKTEPGYTRLKVLYCAICRTDAKMYHQGHHDLILPRVLGHEIAAYDEQTGELFTIWPGDVCGSCSYCREGLENLCEDIRITGFHSDGGFSDHIIIPRSSLIPASGIKRPEILCFAEPVACVLNTLSGVAFNENSRVIIYGGGVVGLLSGFICRTMGADVTIIEADEEKIDKCEKRNLPSLFNISLCKQTNESDFDLAINCCDSHIAFSQCIVKLKKGGRLSHFSGIKKNEEIDTNLLNLIHYKELEIKGSYGQRREHMHRAVKFLTSHQSQVSLLIESILLPDQVNGVMADVLLGKTFKYIIDFQQLATSRHEPCATVDENNGLITTNSFHNSSILQNFSHIQLTGKHIKSSAQKKVDHKTKPLGALGQLEDLAIQMCCIQNNLKPETNNKKLFVFAGDHGIVEEGVSAYPAKVTRQMVENFLDEGAAINVFCSQYDISLSIVDMGVKYDFSDHPLLINKKVAYGTRNFSLQPAMTEKETVKSIEHGAEVFLEMVKADECHILGVGEMGIGNTTSATAIISSVTGISIAELVGRGTGVDNEGLKRKREILDKAIQLHKPINNAPIDILSKVGGFEIAGMCGAILMAAQNNCAVVLDGVISTAAGLISYLIEPDVKPFLIAGHKSVEHAQQAALDYIGLKPLIDLDMRLGEGTGAAIAINLTELACKMMRDMATFEDAGIDGKIE